MWETYEPPGDKPATPATSPAVPDPGLGPARPGRRGSIRTGPRSNGAGAAIGVVAVLASIGIGIGVASSVDAEPDYSGFHECVAEYDGDGGLLSPADLCEIGNDVPPDYVDTYEYDPGYDNEYDNGFGY